MYRSPTRAAVAALALSLPIILGSCARSGEVDARRTVASSPQTVPAPGVRPPCMPAGAHLGAMLPDTPYFEFQVERPARALPSDVNPSDPAELKRAGVEGEVLVQYVVDVTGCFDPRGLKVLRSDHEQFLESVRRVLPYYRYTPAELGGRTVRQWVQHPFVFQLEP